MTNDEIKLGQATQSISNMVSRAGHLIPKLCFSIHPDLTQKGRDDSLKGIEAEIIDIISRAETALESIRSIK